MGELTNAKTLTELLSPQLTADHLEETLHHGVSSPCCFLLADLVKATADQLREIRRAAPTKDEAIIQLSECTVELSVKVTTKGAGKLKFMVARSARAPPTKISTR
jgi:hypothetical protein